MHIQNLKKPLFHSVTNKMPSMEMFDLIEMISSLRAKVKPENSAFILAFRDRTTGSLGVLLYWKDNEHTSAFHEYDPKAKSFSWGVTTKNDLAQNIASLHRALEVLEDDSSSEADMRAARKTIKDMGNIIEFITAPFDPD